MTPTGIEPATVWFVAQCFNQLRHSVPPESTAKYKNNFVISCSKIHRNFDPFQK